MTSVKRVEKKIQKVEGFLVKILHKDGCDVRDDKRKMPGYSYQRKAKGTMSVSQWIEKRFRKRYPGFDIKVLDAKKKPRHGRTLLSKIRDTFS